MQDFVFGTTLLGISLFIGILVCLEIGRRIGVRNFSNNKANEGYGAVEAALFGLLGLLMAFTFSNAATRFDDRRELIVQEANAIGTAYLRLDLLSPEAQPALRDKFRQYVDSRLETYRKVPDYVAVEAEIKRSTELQKEIWTDSVKASRESDWVPPATLLLPALNEMIDITTTRSAAAQMHPPAIIFIMLSVLLLASALLAGFGMAKSKTRSWLHIFVFSTILALTVYVIIDIEYPRLGLIRVDSFDGVLVNVRESMQ